MSAEVVGGTLLGVAALVSAIWGGWRVLSDSRSASSSRNVDHVKLLLERVGVLEHDVSELRDRFSSEQAVTRSALSFIERLAWLWPQRDTPFPPLPRALQDRLDPDLWQHWTPPQDRDD